MQGSGLIQVPGSQVADLVLSNPPKGEPWGWLLARGLLESSALGRVLIERGLTPGLEQLLGSELTALRIHHAKLLEANPLGDLGMREPHPAEWAALEVLHHGGPETLIELYRTHGYSPFATATAFFYDGQLSPVHHPDPVDFSTLAGYGRQIRALRHNVERFLGGQPALATLLYGARGSGKSTSVKALRSTYAERGLRLIEVLIEGLERLPELLETLRPLPHRFVLYLDDLALSTGDAQFHKLKALLEGAVFERPANVLVIATSNRRNLVSESWTDRPEPGSPDPAAWDTLQDKLALADRFGLVLTFAPFDQQAYLDTIAFLLGRQLDQDTRHNALGFARDGRGFSGRSARQFSDFFGS
jgi:hypothetical protein